MIALIDCNSFYASCEKAFQPKLRNKPVVVLSNNDGCVIARSTEAKRCGIPMGVPFFKVREQVAQHKVHVFSSNYTLYGDMSSRVMKTLAQFTPALEIYSIDEAFLNLRGFESYDLKKLGKEIREVVLQHTGIPVSVGIAPTKVLAKVANTIAKEDQQHEGVVCLNSQNDIDLALADFPVGEIWGIGWKLETKLNGRGIFKVPQLLNLQENMVRKWLHVQVHRIIKELKGIPCLSVKDFEEPRKQIMSTRSFGKTIFNKSDLREAISCHVTTAAEKLREQGSIAHSITAFIRTARHTKYEKYYGSASAGIDPGTSSTNKLIFAAMSIVDQIYKKGIHYKKCGIYLSMLTDKDSVQENLFTHSDTSKQDKLMSVVDQINRKQGRSKIQFASCGGYDHNWSMKSEHRSPCYTTRWDEVLSI
jgi:DNA polymerase V